MNFEKWQHLLRARYFQFMNKNGAALEEYRLLLQIEPDNARTFETVAFIYANSGDFGAAATHFREVLRIEPENAEVYFNLGFACDKKDELNEAIEAFQNATRLKATLDRAWYGLGICFAKLGKHAEAAQALHEAATQQPMNPHAWYALGMAHHHLHDAERVTEIIQHLHRFDPIMTRHLIQDTGRSDLAHLVADLAA